MWFVHKEFIDTALVPRPVAALERLRLAGDECAITFVACAALEMSGATRPQITAALESAPVEDILGACWRVLKRVPPAEALQLIAAAKAASEELKDQRV